MITGFVLIDDLISLNSVAVFIAITYLYQMTIDDDCN